MLNVINGVYHPQQGSVVFQGPQAPRRRSHEAARQGIARHLSEYRPFPRMTVLDNIMTGRNLKMKSNFLQQALYWGARAARGARAPRQGRDGHRLPRDRAYTPRPRSAGCLWTAEARGAGARPCSGAGAVAADEPMAGMNLEEKQDMSRFILDVNDQLAPPSF